MQGGKKRTRPFVRIVVGLLAALFVVVAGYTARDIRQGKIMAVDACSRAATGSQLEELLPVFPVKDYRIIKGPARIFLVPRKGMGRFSCTLSHDGRQVTGSSVTFTD